MDASVETIFEKVRTVHEIVGECTDLWVDPAAWQTHLLTRAAKLVDCRVGIYYELADAPGKICSKILSATDTGWSTDSERRTLIEGLATKELTYSPLWATFASDLTHGKGKTLRQLAVIDDKRWHSSEMYDHHVRPTRLGQGILSAIWMPHLSRWSMWCLVNDRSDRSLTIDQEEWIGILHRQVTPLIGTRLCSLQNRSMDQLSHRRREVLKHLLNGHSEKQIAALMHRSLGAVHEHVMHLYRHFNVTSRSELAAYFIRRQPVINATKPAFDLMTNWLDR